MKNFFAAIALSTILLPGCSKNVEHPTKVNFEYNSGTVFTINKAIINESGILKDISSEISNLERQLKGMNRNPDFDIALSYDVPAKDQLIKIVEDSRKMLKGETTSLKKSDVKKTFRALSTNYLAQVSEHVLSEYIESQSTFNNKQFEFEPGGELLLILQHDLTQKDTTLFRPFIVNLEKPWQGSDIIESEHIKPLGKKRQYSSTSENIGMFLLMLTDKKLIGSLVEVK